MLNGLGAFAGGAIRWDASWPGDEVTSAIHRRAEKIQCARWGIASGEDGRNQSPQGKTKPVKGGKR